MIKEDNFGYQSEICRRFTKLTGISVEPHILFNCNGSKEGLKDTFKGSDVSKLESVFNELFNEDTFDEIFKHKNTFSSYAEINEYVLSHNDYYISLIAVEIMAYLYLALMEEDEKEEKLELLKNQFGTDCSDYDQCSYQVLVKIFEKLVGIATELNDNNLLFCQDVYLLEERTFQIRKIYAYDMDEDGELEEQYNTLCNSVGIVDIEEY